MTLSSSRRLLVISAGPSQPSSSRLLAERLTDATVRRTAEQGVQTEVRVVELRVQEGGSVPPTAASFRPNSNGAGGGVRRPPR